jgi:hypothetical protein
MKNSKTVSFKEGEPEIFTYDQDKSILESEREKAFRESLKNAAPVVEYKPCKRSGLSEIFRPEENALVEEGSFLMAMRAIKMKRVAFGQRYQKKKLLQDLSLRALQLESRLLAQKIFLNYRTTGVSQKRRVRG